MRVDGQHHAPAALLSDKETSIYLKGGWVGTRAGLDRKISPPPEPVASRYTDCDFPANRIV